MDNFTKGHFKKPKDIIKDVKDGDFSLTLRKLDIEKSKKTFEKLSKDGQKIKNKLDKLKEVQSKLIDKDNTSRKEFIQRKKPSIFK
jgi:vacuolar-type H+-ATPase subunit I/STV1